MTLEDLFHPINSNSQLREELLMNRHEHILLLPPGVPVSKTFWQRIMESLPLAPLLTVIAAFLLWAFSLSGLDLAMMSDLGLVSTAILLHRSFSLDCQLLPGGSSGKLPVFTVAPACRGFDCYDS